MYLFTRDIKHFWVAIEQLRTTVVKNIDMFGVEVVQDGFGLQKHFHVFSVGSTSATAPNFQYIHKCLLNGPAGG